MLIGVLGSTGYLAKAVLPRLCQNINNEIYGFHRETSDTSFFKEYKINTCLSDYKSLNECMKNRFDVILNLSCSYMNGCSEDKIIESNLLYPLRALGLALNENKGKKLRFISIGTGLPNHFNLYTFTKNELNRFGKELSKEHNLEYINLELQNYYGPNEPRNRFIPHSVDCMSKGQELDLTNGEQKRDFVYIEDVIDAIIMLVYKKNLPSYFDVPLGSGEAPTIRELIGHLHHLLKSKSKLNWGAIPLRPNEPSIKADLSIYKLLGGTVKYDWKNGFREMLEKEGLL